MKIKEIEYSRTFNLGLRVELDESEDLDEAFRNIKARVVKLHEGSSIETDIGRLRDNFSDEWQERLQFTSDDKYFIVKPKQLASWEGLVDGVEKPLIRELASLLPWLFPQE